MITRDVALIKSFKKFQKVSKGRFKHYHPQHIFTVAVIPYDAHNNPWFSPVFLFSLVYLTGGFGLENLWSLGRPLFKIGTEGKT